MQDIGVGFLHAKMSTATKSVIASIVNDQMMIVECVLTKFMNEPMNEPIDEPIDGYADESNGVGMYDMVGYMLSGSFEYVCEYI